MADQHQVAITLELISGIGDDAVFSRLDRRALRYREIDTVIGLAVGLGTVAGDDLAAHRPAEGRQRACRVGGLDRLFSRNVLDRCCLCQSRLLLGIGRHRGHPCRRRHRRRNGLRGSKGRLGARRRRGGLGRHCQLHAEMEFSGRLDAVGAGEFSHGDMIAPRNAEQGIAVVDDMNKRRGAAAETGLLAGAVSAGADPATAGCGMISCCPGERTRGPL